MKIITHPHVHLLGKMQFFPHPEYELPPHDNDAEKLIAHAGKGCYDSYGVDGRSIPQHIDSLIGSFHGSVLEHAHFSLFLSGISRGCSHEIVRHRQFNYSQRSTRYTAEEGAAIVLDPYYVELKNHRENGLCSWEGYRCIKCDAYDMFISSTKSSVEDYTLTVSHLMSMAPSDKTKVEQRKWARGKARQLLPHALETRMTMTGNLRAWRFFIEQRSSRHAEPEIRRLAQRVFEVLQPEAPEIFKDYNQEEIHGYVEYTTKFMKV